MKVEFLVSMYRQLLLITLSILSVFYSSAQTIVHSSEELQTVLTQDKEVGVLLLDGDWFHIDGVKVNMGGVIKPYGKKKASIGGISTDCE